MFPYWILFSVYAAGALNDGAAHERQRGLRPLFLIAGALTVAMIGLRFEIGGDWFSYRQTFLDIGYQELDVALTLTDPGYAFLNWLAHAAGLGFWAVNMACGLIFVWGLYQFAKEQPSPWLVVVVAVPYLVIVVAMGYTRQALAISLIMASLAALQKQGYLRAAAYILLAVLFHKTAIIVLSLMAFAAARRKVLTAAIAIVSAAALYYLFLAANFDNLVQGYVDQTYASEGALVRVLMNVPPALLFLFFSRRIAPPGFQQKLWRNFSLASFGALTLLFLVEGSTTFVDRLALYLVPLQLYVFGRLPHAFPADGAPNGQLKLAVIAYSAAIQAVWLTSATHRIFWVPYTVYPVSGSY